MEQSNALLIAKELASDAKTPQPMVVFHAECMEPTKAEMFYKAPTIRSIEMLVKPGEKGMSVVRKAYSLPC